ncbi:CPS_collapsed_G0025000.mRNA.1.CDS.1 [Saccharomyces cerevisiae]|nr:CPS_collapsed_G0025000.mRNA.1.CDS.1 [Saccharomyces cerevisiae]
MKVQITNSRTEEILKVQANNENDEVSKATPGEVEESLRLIDDLKFFLATAPVNWQENQIIRRYYLNSGQGFVSCVFWNNLYYITGTDIVKCCLYRMQKFGREVVQKKKFEEGIFSDLRNLKCGIDATLEQPKSEFLSFLFRNMCLKTQKKQKVFFWFSVAHDKLFADALERDLKRESLNQPSTTKPVNGPALSFSYDSSSDKPLYDQLLQHLDSRRPSSTTKSDNSPPKLESENFKDNELVTVTNQPLLGVGLMDDDAPESPSQINDFIPQKLIIEPNTLELNGLTEETPHDLPKNTAKGRDEEDFPLDYFPVSVEYPTEENAFDLFPPQAFTPAAPSMPISYDNVNERDSMPVNSLLNRYPYQGDPLLDQAFYGADDFFFPPEGCDNNMLYPQTATSWNVLPPQAMQPAPTYVGRPYTPNYRSTPGSAMFPYMQSSNSMQWNTAVSPYSSRAPSTTAKNYPPSTFYSQNINQYPRRRTVGMKSSQGNVPTGNKQSVGKSAKISKPLHIKTSAYQKQYKINLETKARPSAGDEDSAHPDKNKEISMPTPDSNTLVVQSEEDGAHSLEVDTNRRSDKNLPDAT